MIAGFVECCQDDWAWKGFVWCVWAGMQLAKGVWFWHARGLVMGCGDSG